MELTVGTVSETDEIYGGVAVVVDILSNAFCVLFFFLGQFFLSFLSIWSRRYLSGELENSTKNKLVYLDIYIIFSSLINIFNYYSEL